MPGDRLERYRAMRDFTKTAEPAGGEPVPGAAPVFVVQKHQATALHYDVRFEVDGVLPSWAVPKGPSYDPKVKRLAVHTEDHPLDYKDFEGDIPDDEYGGGDVIVWDEGTYRNISEHAGHPVTMAEAIERGHVSVWLEGTKLHGGWALTRTHRPGERQDTWIMVKRQDVHADPALDITTDAPASVKSGRLLRERPPAAPRRRYDRTKPSRMPEGFVEPMLAQLSRLPLPTGEQWIFERKYDGLRAIAVRDAAGVRLWSRGGLSYTERFAGIVDALGELAAESFVLDGEIVAFDGDRTSFGLLQHPGGDAPAVYVVFDVLAVLGRDTRLNPLEERRQLLTALVEPGPALRPVERLEGDAQELLDGACRDGWEGLMAKRAGSIYRAGRSSDWRKLKCDDSQELVIGGWTDPRGAREAFGAVLVGHYDADGRLRYAGKVGTGFDQATLSDLAERLAVLAQDQSPFADAPRVRDVHWVEPRLVAEVGFAEWTSDGMLRHPRYKGLRPDKRAEEVVREER
jgi:bifunctional non-homologous end joining protein LigD